MLGTDNPYFFEFLPDHGRVVQIDERSFAVLGPAIQDAFVDPIGIPTRLRLEIGHVWRFGLAKVKEMLGPMTAAGHPAGCKNNDPFRARNV